MLLRLYLAARAEQPVLVDQEVLVDRRVWPVIPEYRGRLAFPVNPVTRELMETTEQQGQGEMPDPLVMAVQAGTKDHFLLAPHLLIPEIRELSPEVPEDRAILAVAVLVAMEVQVIPGR